MTNHLRVFLFLVIAFIGAFVFAHPAYANIPDIEGYILVAGTNAPVANVWVKMTNSAIEDNGCPVNQSRYTKTDASGKYLFLGWTQMENSDKHIGEAIDTNFDGKNDATWYPTYDSCKPDDETPGSIFSCGRDPFAFEVIKPVSWNGTFDSIAKTDSSGNCIFCINNGSFTATVPTLYYHPSPTVSISPTRSLTPTRSATVTPTKSVTPSCSFTAVPTSKNIQVGASEALSVGVSQIGGSVDEVTFTTDNGSVVSVCKSGPCSQGASTFTDTAPAFQTALTGFSPGQSAHIRITGRMLSEGVTCTPSTVLVHVTDTRSWCQFKGTDIVTNGSISCNIPNTCTMDSGCTNSLITYGDGESPGVAYSGSGAISAGAGNISSPIPPYGWQAKTTYNGLRYTYDYFEKKTNGLILTELSFPRINSVSDLTTGGQSEGYYWVHYQGGSTLEVMNNLSVGERKIILFVDSADILFHGTVHVTKGKGLFMVIASGNVLIDSRVGEDSTHADIEGIYFTDQEFKVQTEGEGDDTPIYVRGAIVAFDKIAMERTLSDNSETPSELFEFGPDQIMLFPARLGERTLDWKEVAP